MKVLAFVLFVALTQAACSQSDSTEPAPGGQAGSPAPPASVPTGGIVANEDLSAGLAGTDADKNGVRDDIDRLIANKYAATPALRKASEQTAQALARFMVAGTREQAMEAGNENRRAIECLYRHEAQPGMAATAVKEIEALTANTRERFAKYWESNKLVAGGHFPDPTDPVCN